MIMGKVAGMTHGNASDELGPIYGREFVDSDTRLGQPLLSQL
ncbi:MAG: hypothetical protein ACK58L_13570 [Planctomycetota bacterium]